MKLNKDFFVDVADKLNMRSPAFVEKDYYGVQLLKVIFDASLSNWDLSFAGGTCLAKVHLKNINRMSEDIDLKFTAKPEVARLSSNKQNNLKKNLKVDIIKTIEQSNIFKVIDSSSRNKGSNRIFTVEYPQDFIHSSLRPQLKLELTEVEKFLLPCITSSIGSIYARETKQDDEINDCRCDAFEIILIEKLISLLRRTAKVARGYTEEDDRTLIRHIFDLFFITNHGFNSKAIQDSFYKVIEYDKDKFVSKHKEFIDNPFDELKYGLNELVNSKLYEKRYNKFLGPMVYSNTPPSWQQSINNLKKLLDSILHYFKST